MSKADCYQKAQALRDRAWYTLPGLERERLYHAAHLWAEAGHLLHWGHPSASEFFQRMAAGVTPANATA